jgi:hypothetical protein
MGSPSAFDDSFGPAGGDLSAVNDSPRRRRNRNSQSGSPNEDALVQDFFGVHQPEESSEEEPVLAPTIPLTPSGQRSEHSLIQDGNDFFQKRLEDRIRGQGYSKTEGSNEKPKKERNLDLGNVDWSGFPRSAHSGEERKKRPNARRSSLTGGVIDPKEEEARRAILRQSRRPSLDPNPFVGPPEELLPNSPKPVPENKKFRSRRNSTRDLMSSRMEEPNSNAPQERRRRSRSANRRTHSVGKSNRHSRRQLTEESGEKSAGRRAKSEERKHHRRNRTKDDGENGEKTERKRGERSNKHSSRHGTPRSTKEAPKSLSPGSGRSRKKVSATSLSPSRGRRTVQAAAASTTLQIQNKAYSRAKEGSQRVGRSIPINLDDAPPGAPVLTPLELQNEAMLNKAPAMRAIQW